MLNINFYFLLALTTQAQVIVYNPFNSLVKGVQNGVNRFENLVYGSGQQTNFENYSISNLLGLRSTSTTAQPYQNNQNYQKNQNVYPQVSQALACQGIYSLKQDYSGYFGLITITNPDYSRNLLRVEMSLAARITNVSVKQMGSGIFQILLSLFGQLAKIAFSFWLSVDKSQKRNKCKTSFWMRNT
jgi:hypothetical protein